VNADFNPALFAALLTQTGYQKLPNGMIIQWGFSAATTTGAAVTFPVAYPTAALVVIAGRASSAGDVYASGLTPSGFTFTAIANSNHFWLAIGY
jgi:hypothetical protein